MKCQTDNYNRLYSERVLLFVYDVMFYNKKV